MLKPLTVKITTNCGKLLKMWGYQTTYLSPENPVHRSRSKLVRNRHGTRDWFKIGKRVHQGCILCILSPYTFNLYTEYIMGNARLNETQVGIRIARRNINNLRYADGEGNGNPLQCSCLENPRDGGAWWAAIYGVTQSRTQLKQLTSSSSYAVDTTLMAESKEKLKSLLMKVKEESEKADLKLNIQKILTSWQLVPLLHGQ